MKKPSRKPKPHMTKKHEDAFDKSMMKYLSPLSAQIKKEIAKGKTASQAVAVVFKKNDFKGNLQKIIMDNVTDALRQGLKLGKK